MNWEIVTFGREVCAGPHKWANRALAVPLDSGEAVIIAEACHRCGCVRCGRKAGSGALGIGTRARGSAHG